MKLSEIMASKQGRDLALSMLRTLPRLALNNIRNNPGANKPVSIILKLYCMFIFQYACN